MKNQASRPTEVISFLRGDNVATVVTDGQTHKTYEVELCMSHATVAKAISYLEAKGYRIEMDAAPW